MLGPGESKPVGYSNKSGVLWNLLRDDLGLRPDATPSNFETAYTRGIAAGEYIINIHCFTCPDLPVLVDLEVSVKREGSNTTGVDGKRDTIIKIIIVTQVTLRFNKQEKTAVRFRLTEDGDLIKNSVNSVYRKMKGSVVGGIDG